MYAAVRGNTICTSGRVAGRDFYATAAVGEADAVDRLHNGHFGMLSTDMSAMHEAAACQVKSASALSARQRVRQA